MADNDTKRIALVMAGSRGLGYACASALGRDGRRVVICGRDRPALDAAVTALADEGTEAHPVVADVSDAAAIERLFTEIDGLDGHLDVIIANAGGPPAGAFAKVTEEEWEFAFQLTFMSVVRAIWHALPRLRAAGGGRIIVLGSSSVRRPIPGLTLSNAFRPGLAGLVKSLAVELAAKGITVNMVSPGRIGTDRTLELDERRAMDQGISVEDVRANSAATIPAGRYGKPEELGSLVAYLASPATAYITGQSILVDGAYVPTLP